MVQSNATVHAGCGSHVLQQRTMNDGLTLLTGRTEAHKRLKTCWEPPPPFPFLPPLPVPRAVEASGLGMRLALDPAPVPKASPGSSSRPVALASLAGPPVPQGLADLRMHLPGCTRPLLHSCSDPPCQGPVRAVGASQVEEMGLSLENISL